MPGWAENPKISPISSRTQDCSHDLRILSYYTGTNESILRKAPMDDILVSMNKTKLRDSEELRTTTTLALFNQNTVHKNESTSYTRLKNMVNRYLDQLTKDRNCDARNDRIAGGAPNRKETQDRSKSENGKTGGLWTMVC